MEGSDTGANFSDLLEGGGGGGEGGEERRGEEEQILRQQAAPPTSIPNISGFFQNSVERRQSGRSGAGREEQPPKQSPVSKLIASSLREPLCSPINCLPLLLSSPLLSVAKANPSLILPINLF